MWLRNKKLVILGGLIVTIGLFSWIKAYNNQRNSDKNSSSNAIILLNQSDVQTAKQQTINDAVYFTGDLSAKTQTIISSEVDAKVNKVYVQEGQIVKSGQLLATLDTLDLSQAVSQQIAQLAVAKAKLDLDKQKMDKQAELLKQGFISQIAFDELVSNYQSSLQSYKAQEALLIRSKKQLADTNILAPFSGIIYQKSIEPGQLAAKNSKLFALANLENMEIKAAIPSDKINGIALGQSVMFNVETNKHNYAGKVSRINQVAVSGTRSYNIYIDFDNSKSNLKAGQFVKGKIILRTLDKQIVINCNTLRNTNNNGQYVLTLKNQQVNNQTVSLILEDKSSGLCAVNGLKPQEQVLSGNVLTVKSGDKVRIVQD
ncbi:MAG: hypothetical protein RLZZ293_1129 [Pseudomonadota bacterium]|jgi:RND family efflux transporter MFP subunit